MRSEKNIQKPSLDHCVSSLRLSRRETHKSSIIKDPTVAQDSHEKKVLARDDADHPTRVDDWQMSEPQGAEERVHTCE